MRRSSRGVSVALAAVAALAMVAFGPASIRIALARTWVQVTEPPLSISELGDAGPAAELWLADPMGLALDSSGYLYVSDRGRRLRGRVVWRIDTGGLAHAVAGNGERGDPVEGDPARGTPLGGPEGLAFDSDGRLHFVDASNHRVFRIGPDGRLTIVAGTGVPGFGGDGGPAVDAMLHDPADLRFDAAGNLYVADVSNHRIRRVRTDGTIETVVGTGEAGYSGDGGPAALARLNEPWGVFVDAVSGDLLIGDGGNHVVRRVDSAGIIRTFAGVGTPGYTGDGGPATAAQLDGPQSFATDCAGTLYIGDEHNHVIRSVDSLGTIRTVVGDGTSGLATDGTPAREARMNDPENLLASCDGTLYVTDGDNGRVLRVEPAGGVWNFAGRASRR